MQAGTCHPAVEKAFEFLQSIPAKKMQSIIDLYASRAERGDPLAIENHRTLASMLAGNPVIDKNMLGLTVTIMLEHYTLQHFKPCYKEREELLLLSDVAEAHRHMCESEPLPENTRYFAEYTK